MHMSPMDVMEMEVYEIRWMHEKLKETRNNEMKEVEKISREMKSK